jgi:hypothetical protein
VHDLNKAEEKDLFQLDIQVNLELHNSSGQMKHRATSQASTVQTNAVAENQKQKISYKESI